jgi:glycosyltransferase involved in cell wall biosynthesis
VVASRVGGNPEMLTEWLAQFLFEPGDIKGLSEKLASLHGWRQDRPDVGERCRREAVDRFSLDTEIDTIEGHLEHAAGAHPRRQRRRV